MIRFARAEDVPALKRLWMEAFHDSVQATDLYFERRMRLDEMLIDAQPGGPRAMLTMMRCQLAAGARVLPARYFFAIATALEHRGQGLSTRLMQEAERLTREAGGAAAVLVPADKGLFDFYGRRGYRTAFWYDLLRLTPGDLPPCPKGARLLEARPEDLLRLRERAFGGSRLFLRWDEAALRYALEASAAYQAPLLRFEAVGGEGYAYCEWEGRTLTVKELALIGLGPLEAAALLHRELGADAYALRLQQGSHPGARTRPFGMMKALRPLPEAEGTAPYMSFAKD